MSKSPQIKKAIFKKTPETKKPELLNPEQIAARRVPIEDVELNLTCLIFGFKNYYDGSLVAYHYESKTRGKNIENSKKESLDYSETLLPFIQKNYNKLFKK